MDRFTKLVRTVPLKNIRAKDVAKAFVTNWVMAYGPPKRVLSDNGKQFTSRLFQHTCRLLGAKNVFTTAYHPQSNGQVERYNRTILNALRHYTADHPKTWDQFTDVVTYAYNTQVHSSTGISPFELVLSRPPSTASLSTEPDIRDGLAPWEYKIRWLAWLSKMLRDTKRQLAKRQARYKRDFDKHTRPTNAEYPPGSFVFVRKEHWNEKRESIPNRHKLAPIADGPFEVQASNDDTVVVKYRDGNVERISRDRVVQAPQRGNAELAPTLQDSGSPPEQQISANADSSEEAMKPLTPDDSTHLPAPLVNEELIAGATTNESSNPRVGLEVALGSKSTARGIVTRTFNQTELDLRTHEAATDAAQTSSTDEHTDEGVPQTNQGAADGTNHHAPHANQGAGVSIREVKRADPSHKAHDDIDQSSSDDEEQPAPLRRSSRSAAQKANERLSTRKVKRKSRKNVRFNTEPDFVEEPFDEERHLRGDEDDTYREEYVIDHIVSHGFANDGALYYKCKWYGYDEQTWEPTRHIPRSQIVSYYHRIRQPLPSDINNTQVG